MKISSLIALALMLASAPSVLANGAAPPRLAEGAKPFVIEADPKAQEAKLIIPRDMLGKQKAALDVDNENEGYASTSRSHTIIAGVALTMALAFSGLWLVRRTPNGSRNLALLIGAVGFLGIGGFLWADLPAPPRPAKTDMVVIEVVEKGDAVKLIVNKDKLAKIVEKK